MMDNIEFTSTKMSRLRGLPIASGLTVGTTTRQSFLRQNRLKMPETSEV
jgi:hypothetical protein